MPKGLDKVTIVDGEQKFILGFSLDDGSPTILTVDIEDALESLLIFELFIVPIKF